MWTFRATAFEPNGVLTATTEVGGETVTLSGLGQIGETELAWQLDANGDTDPGVYTRVRIPAAVPQGAVTVTFSDGTTTIERVLEVEAAPTVASVEVVPVGELGGSIRLTGEGFFHPTSTEQGSRIALKIDDGAFSRLDSSLHSNRTIWWTIDAELDGSFDVEVPLPNGTMADDPDAGTSGSTPAFPAGEHSFRLLTGSLLTGDPSRTLKTESFMVSSGAPMVTEHPASQSVEAGSTVTFTAAAVGTPEPSVQWESSADGVSWTPIDGATGSTLTLEAVTAEQSGAHYRAVFANASGQAVSDPATLTVGQEEEPVLTGQIEVTFGVAAESGGLSLHLTGTEVDLGTAALNAGIDRLVAEGTLPTVRVADTRAADLGWSVTGVSSGFAGAADARLGWTPNVLSTTAGQSATAGPVVAPEVGLLTGATLVQAPAGAGRGTAEANAVLRLEAPTTTAVGNYQATLTLTLS